MTTTPIVSSLYGDNATSGNTTSGNTPAKTDTPASQKQMFLQLLVAQIKNQNPLNPADGAAFLAQLATFTQVEETLGMRQELESIHQLLAGGTPSPVTSQP